MLAYTAWTRQQLLQVRLAKLVFLCIPEPPPGDDIAIASTMKQTASNALRECILTLFPELQDQQIDKESELAEFLRERATKPIELRISEGARGNIDVSLQR